MDVRLPDGTLIKDVPDSITKAELTQKLAKNGYDVSKLGPTPIPDALGGRVGQAVTDTAATMASGALAAPVAGLAGIAGGVLPGPQGQSGQWVEKVQNALTLQPQSQGGKTLLNAVTYPFQKLGELADFAGQKVADKAGPAAGAAVNTAIQMAPAAISAVMGGKARGAIDEKIGANESATAKANSLASIKNQTVKEALDAGYVLPPSQMGKDGFLTKRLEGVGGKAALKQEVQIRNQQVTDSLARKAIEVEDHVPLSMEVLKQKRNEFAQPYREIADLSPRAATALEKLKEARADANAWYTFHERNAHPAALKRAERFSDRAEMLERVIEKEASRAGQPSLLDNLREARAKLAKTYEIEKALNLGNGEVSARSLGSSYDKGKPLSGELLTIAKFDRAFNGRYTRPASAVDTPGVSALEVPAAAGLGMGGRGSGIGWLPAGLPFLGGPAREALLSGAYQRPPVPQAYAPGLGLRGASLLFDENAPIPLGMIQASQ